jgi:DNA processing protein
VNGFERAAYLAIAAIPRMGRRRMHALLQAFNGDFSAMLSASPTQLRKVDGVGEKTAAAITQIDMPALILQIAAWHADGLFFALPDDPVYPAAFAALPDPPLFVCGRGNLALRGAPVAIVGTRQPHATTRNKAHALAHEHASHGHTVISGLALGIDTAAHRGALDAHGHTVAVLGCGVNAIYPSANHALSREILAAGGALISEMLPDVVVSSQGLVTRNRLIAALCAHLMVIETADDGGAMYAAKHAHALGKPISTLEFAATGNRTLIAQGAYPLQL